MKMVHVFLFAFMSVVVFVAGGFFWFRQKGCDGFYRGGHNLPPVSEVISWADKNVLGKKFSAGDFTVGHISAPVSRTGALNLIRIGAEVPVWLEGHEIRVVGNIDAPVDMIYIGIDRYRGILVSRDNLDGAIGKEGLFRENIRQSGRVGFYCYDEERRD